MQQQQHQSPYTGGQMMMHAPMLLQNSTQVMPPGPHQAGRHQQMQQHLGHYPQQQLQQQQPQHQQQQQQQQHLSYHQIHHHQASPHSHGSPVSHSGSPHPQPQMHHQLPQHHPHPLQHQQSAAGQLPQQHQHQITIHPQSPHSHNGPTMLMQQQPQLHQPQQINQLSRSSMGPAPVMNHQRTSLQQSSHHNHHQSQQFYNSCAIKSSNVAQYPQQTQHHPHHQHIAQQNQQSHHHHNSSQVPHGPSPPVTQQLHSGMPPGPPSGPSPLAGYGVTPPPPGPPPPSQMHPQMHHPMQHSPMDSRHGSPFNQNIPQTEYRIIELNKRLQSRPRSNRGQMSPLPSSFIGFPDDTYWWEKFACDFFDDDATLTIRVPEPNEKQPTEYKIGRTLIPRYFKTYFDGGVSDFSIKLHHTDEFNHPTNPNWVILRCDRTDITTKNVFRHPATGMPSHFVVHTEGQLTLEFCANSMLVDTLLIKSWRFDTRQCNEFIDRSMSYLNEPVTRHGLTKRTINYLKMCMIMEPMQELMFQNRITDQKMRPKDCLKDLLFKKFQITPAVEEKKQKRKRAARNTNTGATKKSKAQQLNNNNSMNSMNNSMIKNNNSNSMVSYNNILPPAGVLGSAGGGGVPTMPLASQDVMVVGEPSMMGVDFSDDNERMITRLEDTHYEHKLGPTVAKEPQGTNNFTGAKEVSNSNQNNADHNNAENHTVSPSLVQQQRQQSQQQAPALSAQPSVPHHLFQAEQSPSPCVKESQHNHQHADQKVQHNNQDQSQDAVVTEQHHQANSETVSHNETEPPRPSQTTTETSHSVSKDSEHHQVKLENCQDNESTSSKQQIHQSETSAQEKDSTRDSFKSIDTKGEESADTQISERKNGESKPKESPNEGSNESTVSTKISSSKQNRRRSSERKETLREGLMRTSDFVVAMKDLKSEHPALWRITTGNNLLQQFEPKTQKGMILYENTNQYAGWNPEIKKDYVGVDVKLTQQNRNQIFVERLFLNFQKIEDADSFYDKHFVIYLQIIISTALDPKFWESIEGDPKHHDYFITSRRIIEDIIKRHKVKISSRLKLSEVVFKQIEKYPNVVVTPQTKDSKEQLCRACNTNPSTQILSFANRSYDLHTYRLVQVTGELIDDNELKHNLCDSCLDLVKLYSSTHHIGWKLFNLARERVGRPQTKDKPINAILDECLKDENWLTQMYSERDSIWSRCEVI